jgi:hydroxyacylglutathione hydrolase
MNSSTPLIQTSTYALHLIDVGNRLCNYIYLLHCRETGVTAAIDPTVAEPVLRALEVRGWTLNLILTTHHHDDHVGGNTELKAATGCTIIGSAPDAARIPAIDVGVAGGERVSVGNLTAHVMEVSGHTNGHIAYHFKDAFLLFCGDVLFSLGCGRIFEGTPEQMYGSLSRIASLPEETHLCPAHEYTLSNGQFALLYEPSNIVLQARVSEVEALRFARKPTVPVLLAGEKATNPFLRCDRAEIKTSLGMLGATDIAIFAALRKLKDAF